MKKYSLYIDDIRSPTTNCPVGDQWIIKRNYVDVFQYILRHGMPTYISFDHDLGENEKSGKDIVNALIDFDLDECDNFKFPKDFDYNVHSANHVGRDNIIGLFESYFKFKNNR